MYAISFTPSFRKETMDFFFGKLSLLKLPFILIFAIVPCIGLWYLFDKQVKVRIDNDGIWSRKYGTLAWVNICFFSSSICKMRNDGDIYRLHITSKGPDGLLSDEEILTFRRMDKNFDEIRAAVEYYAGKYNIEDKGHEKEE